jgi:hypothetical protein
MPSDVVATGAAAVLFAGTFLCGGRVYPLRSLVRDRRSLISFSSGIATAYVFVHVMPELASMRREFAESASMPLRYGGIAIYLVAMIGFLLYYGLDRLHRHLQEGENEADRVLAFQLHLGGFAAYVFLMGYLLVNNLRDTATATLLFALAISVHFLGIDHSLREQHSMKYERFGRYLLAAMALAGYTVGHLLEFGALVLALAVAFVSGAIIMNSMIAELPPEKDGRFMPFMAGGMLYGLVLVPMSG